MTKWDKLLIICIIIVSVAGIKISANKASNEDSLYLKIQVDGEIYKKLIIDENTEHLIIPINTPYGYNEVVVEGKSVWMLNSDCEDKVCEKFGIIKHSNETLICIPHRVSVSLESRDKKDDIDIVSY